MKRHGMHSVSLAVLRRGLGVSSQHMMTKAWKASHPRRRVSGGGCLYAIPLIPRLPGVGACAAHASTSGLVALVEPCHQGAISTNSGVSSFTGNNGESYLVGVLVVCRARSAWNKSLLCSKHKTLHLRWLLGCSGSHLHSTLCLAIATLITTGIWPFPSIVLLRDHFL